MARVNFGMDVGGFNGMPKMLSLNFVADIDLGVYYLEIDSDDWDDSKIEEVLKYLKELKKIPRLERKEKISGMGMAIGVHEMELFARHALKEIELWNSPEE